MSRWDTLIHISLHEVMQTTTVLQALPGIWPALGTCAPLTAAMRICIKSSLKMAFVSFSACKHVGWHFSPHAVRGQWRLAKSAAVADLLLYTACACG